MKEKCTYIAYFIESELQKMRSKDKKERKNIKELKRNMLEIYFHIANDKQQTVF